MNQTAAPSLKAVDLLPPHILGKELPPTAFTDAFRDFLVLSIPSILICAGAVIGIVELGKRGADAWIILVLAGVALAAIVVLAYGEYAYRMRVEDHRNDKNTRREAVMMLSFAIQNLTVNNVEVKGRNNTVTLNQTQTAEQVNFTPDTTTTELYRVALHIAKKGAAAWREKGGRPKPKPISANAIGGELNIGGELWQDALTLTDEAGITAAGAHPSAWRILVLDPKQIEDALLKAMLRRGYRSQWDNGEQRFYRINSPALLNG